MTNRQRVTDAYIAAATARLRDEVAYFMDTYSDTEGYDIADALNDALNHAEANYDKPMARDCTNVLIAAGYYKPRVGEVVIMGRDRSPVRKGVRYDCEAAWCVWIDG
jgi:hypothetical protein